MSTDRDELLKRLLEIVRDLSGEETDKVMVFVETLQSQRTQEPS